MIDRDSNVYRPGIGMPQHIRQGFLESAEERQLGLTGQGRQGLRHGESGSNAAALTEVGYQGPQRREQAEIVQQ